MKRGRERETWHFRELGGLELRLTAPLSEVLSGVQSMAQEACSCVCVHAHDHQCK